MLWALPRWACWGAMAVLGGRVASRRSRSAVHEASQGAEYDVLDEPGQYALAMLRAQVSASGRHVQ